MGSTFFPRRKLNLVLPNWWYMVLGGLIENPPWVRQPMEGTVGIWGGNLRVSTGWEERPSLRFWATRPRKGVPSGVPEGVPGLIFFPNQG